jgi:uncharacterized protein DUF6398
VDKPKHILVPAGRREVFEKIKFQTDAFCSKYLTEEYGDLCRLMTADLRALQPSPLDKGRVHTWAAGIVFTVGSINFLNDPTFDPYLSTDDLAALMSVSAGTLYTKRKQIEKTLDVMPFDPDYTLPSMMEENPLIWMVEVNGFIVDIRDAPREIQMEAYEQGLIPYLPSESWDGIVEEVEEPLSNPQDRDEVKVIKFPGPTEILPPDSPPKKPQKKTKGT